MPDSPTEFSNPAFFSSLKKDLAASLSVFFVALPLCLGIALACDAPLEAGLLAGAIGGLVIGILSGSHTSVSGPAAGMVAVVLSVQAELGSFSAFGLALVMAGVVQLVFGLAQIGFVAKFIPKNIIQGLLVAIGLILILKQIPNALGLNEDYFGDFTFSQINGRNTFSEIWKALRSIHFPSFLVFGISLLMSIWWEKKKIFETWNLPSSLAVVVLGLMVQSGLQYFYPDGAFTSSELVQIPAFNQSSFTFHLPEMHNWLDIKLWKAGLTIALVASLETLLNLKATDNLDPYERKSPPNHELMAQGLGNFFAGILGGIPITSVVVRSSVNIQSGARSRWSAVLHGFWLVGSMVFLFPVLNFIPLCSLSTLLILGGYKLAKASIFRKMYQRGVAKFIPFLLTILAIVFTDLLIGILLGWISHGIIGRIKLKTLERNGAVKVEAR